MVALFKVEPFQQQFFRADGWLCFEAKQTFLNPCKALTKIVCRLILMAILEMFLCGLGKEQIIHG